MYMKVFRFDHLSVNIAIIYCWSSILYCWSWRSTIKSMITLVVYHLHEKTVWFTVWAIGKQIPYCDIPFGTGVYHLHKSFPFTERVWNWYQRWGLTKWNMNFRSEIPILVYLSRNPVFPGNFPFGKTKLVFPFTFQLKFPDFFCKW